MRKNKVAKNVKEFLLDLIFMTAGSVIYAVGLNGFTAPNNIAPGGVSGIAIVLNYLFGTPVGTVILLINVPDRKSTRLNSSHSTSSRMPSSA